MQANQDQRKLSWRYNLCWKNTKNGKKKNEGSFNDFMKNASDKVRIIKLKHGGAVEDYGDLIDAYEKGIDVIEGETLTEYINRIRAGEKK